MKGSKKGKGVAINIHLTNRWLYFLITLGILIVVSTGIYAANLIQTYNSNGNFNIPNPGHSINDSAPPNPCPSNEYLQFNGTGNSQWNCASGGKMTLFPYTQSCTNTAACTVFCPTGQQVTGGGCNAGTPLTESINVGTSGWQCITSSSTLSIIAEAICAS